MQYTFIHTGIKVMFQSLNGDEVEFFWMQGKHIIITFNNKGLEAFTKSL